jgi:hypothetical protein
VDYFQPLFPDIPVKRSLSRLVAQKGRGFLTKTYIGNVWLPNEQERWPAKRQSDTAENHPTPDHQEYSDPIRREQRIGKAAAAALEELAAFKRTQNRTEESQ